MEKPATSSRAGGAVGLLVLGFGLALAIAVLVTVVGAGAVAMMLSSQGGAPETVVPPTPAEVAVNDDAGGGGEDTPAPVAAEEPEEDAEQPAEEAEEAAEEAPAEVTGARFVSRVENTKKISVRCDGGSASGTDVAVVEGEAIGLCTVTVLGSDRSRHKAVVKGVKPGEYDCFAAGSDTCE